MQQLARQPSRERAGAVRELCLGASNVTFDFIFLCQLRKLPSFHNAWKTNQNGAACGTYESPTRWPGGNLQLTENIRTENTLYIVDIIEIHCVHLLWVGYCRTLLPICLVLLVLLRGIGAPLLIGVLPHATCTCPASGPRVQVYLAFYNFLAESQSWKCVTSCCHLFISQINITKHTHPHTHTLTGTHTHQYTQTLTNKSKYIHRSIRQSDELCELLFWTLKLKCQQK